MTPAYRCEVCSFLKQTLFANTPPFDEFDKKNSFPPSAPFVYPSRPVHFPVAPPVQPVPPVAPPPSLPVAPVASPSLPVASPSLPVVTSVDSPPIPYFPSDSFVPSSPPVPYVYRPSMPAHYDVIHKQSFSHYTVWPVFVFSFVMLFASLGICKIKNKKKETRCQNSTLELQTIKI